MRPTSPRESRKITRSSPSRRTFFGGPSGVGSAEEGRHGIQYWRIRSPIGVPGPTRHRSSLSSLESIAVLLVIAGERVNLWRSPCRRRSALGLVAGDIGGLPTAVTCLGASIPGAISGPLSTSLPAALSGAFARAISAAVTSSLRRAISAAVTGSLRRAISAAVTGAFGGAISAAVARRLSGTTTRCFPGAIAASVTGALAGPVATEIARSLAGTLASSFAAGLARSSRGAVAPFAPALRRLDFHLGPGRESRQAVGHDALARLQTLGDDRLVALRASSGDSA